MQKKIKNKKESMNIILVCLLFFYFLLSLFMTIVGIFIIIKYSHIVINGTDITKKISLMLYAGLSFIIGFIMFLGIIPGWIGLIKQNMSWILFSITVIVFSHFIFVLMDGYYSSVYGIMDYFNYLVNIIALCSSLYLFILGYKKEEKLLKS